MLKSCGCYAKTGTGGSFLRWSSESRERNGLGRSALGRCVPAGKTGRNEMRPLPVNESRWNAGAIVRVNFTNLELHSSHQFKRSGVSEMPAFRVRELHSETPLRVGPLSMT